MLYFDRIPGKKLEEIPQIFWGDFNQYVTNKEEKPSNSDTTKYTINAKGWTEFGKEVSKTLLSDSVILSKYKKYYFLSVKDQKGYNVSIIKVNKKGFIFSLVGIESGGIQILRHYFSDVKEIKDGDYSDYLVTMSEKELIKFYKKYLKREAFYTFEKIISKY